MLVSCPLCENTESVVIRRVTSADHYLDLIGKSYTSASRAWLQCANCGLIHNATRLSEQEIAELYARFRNQEWRNESPDQYFDRITSLPDSESENSQKFRIINRATSVSQRGEGSVLDVGCGGGVLIETMRKTLGNSWSYFGVEPTASFAELAGRRTGARVSNSNYTADIFSDQKFDLITCCQVLEHLESPRKLLSDVLLDLKADGFFYLEVPDVADFSTLPEGHDRFMVQHISYFSEPVLREALEDAGFTIVHFGITTTVRGRNNLWFVAQPKATKR
jgi:SAM-dependent methyltransferase